MGKLYHKKANHMCKAKFLYACGSLKNSCQPKKLYKEKIISKNRQILARFIKKYFKNASVTNCRQTLLHMLSLCYRSGSYLYYTSAL